ncbi:brefeldin A-inhibited guanine nucleotide-exchange protein 3-like [Macrobrachium nipponense]|uniref:brefeldin A-inhibited guanine nucleotide-exchange protein 3-like n=1 Tax=Macrobrachium nipponense TaxID=159736 RepID=UPI0030C8BA69
MEEVLEQLIRETSSNKYGQIRQACIEARDLLESQAALLRSPPHELRANIALKAMQLSLESRQSKLVSLAVSGFSKLLRDTQFHSGYEEDDETTWLPCQLLASIQSALSSRRVAGGAPKGMMLIFKIYEKERKF